MCHDNEEWYKNWRGTGLSIQNWHEEFNKFWSEDSKISNICTILGCLWPKYIMFELKKVERSYVWWHWRLMQNLKENWFVLLKLTWGIWKIYTRELESLEILTLMGFFCPKLENVWAENLQESYLSWQWRKM